MGVNYSLWANESKSNKRKAEEISSDAEDETLRTPVRKKLKTSDYIYERLFECGEGSDITVSVLGHEWHLHRIYLSQSDYFAKMLGGTWKEAKSDRIELQLDAASAVTVKSLDQVFGSLYRDDITIEPVEVIPLVAAATLLQLESVIQRGAEVMSENINERTVCAYYGAAEDYGLIVVKSRCVEWLLVNLVSCAGNPAFLKGISVPLMEQLLASSKLVVVQGEVDVYALLRKPGCRKANNALKQVSDEYFERRKKNALSFLEGPEGAEFVSLFQRLRLAHILTSSKTVSGLLADNIIPRNVLGAEMAALWQAQLRMESTFNTPADNMLKISDACFDRQCLRCGRVLPLDTAYCWRWSGYNLGVDILLVYRHRTFSIKRNTTSQACQYAVNMAAERPVMYRLKVLSQDPGNCQNIIWCAESGLKRLTLRQDESKLVLRIPVEVNFPVTVVFNYLTCPLPEMGDDETSWHTSFATHATSAGLNDSDLQGADILNID